MSIKVKTAARRFALLGALTMIVGLGVASAASATTPVWTQNGTHTPYGKEVSFSGSSVSGMNLRWNYAGLPFWIQCWSLSASGKTENYTYGVAGTLQPSGSGMFKGCVVAQVGEQYFPTTTCSVPSEIPFKYASGSLTNTPYSGGGLKLSQVQIEFAITKCSSFIDNFPWTFGGDVTGNEGQGAWPGEILFPEGTPLVMNFGGKATIDFGMNIHDATPTPIIIGQEEITTPHNPGHHYWYRGGAKRRGEGPQILVTPGTPQAIKGSGSIAINGTLAGVKTQVSCSGSTTSGSVENPAGGGNGTASVSYALTGCTVPVPAGKSCYIEGGGFTLATMNGVLQKAEAFAPLKLDKSGGGETLATVPIRGCTVAGLNKDFPLTGSLLVSPYMQLETPGKWTVSKTQTESSKLFKWGGNNASASGTLGAETTGGEAVTWTE